MINWQDPTFVWTAAGTVAGVAGLGLTIWLIVIATGARRAARNAEQTVQSYT